MTSFTTIKKTGATAIERSAKSSIDFNEKLVRTEHILKEAAFNFSGRITQANSLGAEDMIISHIINKFNLNIEIFVLQTGRLHTETIALLNRLQTTSKANVVVYHPDEKAVADYVSSYGLDAIYKSIELRKSCCNIRKMEPLARALANKSAWVTGLRREQSNARAGAEAKEADGNRIKLNPLIDWTWGDIWFYIAENQVDHNPLHDQFFSSIGCEPCTRAISVGEDFRAGRWWWEQDSTKECGLHIKPPAPPSSSSIHS